MSDAQLVTAAVVGIVTESFTTGVSATAGNVGLLIALGAMIGALLALAIGCGPVFFSHVNDAGFWLVKEYFGLSLGETLKTWSAMETIISVVGLAGVLLLRALV